MRAYVYKTSCMRSKGQIMESENLEKLCNLILDLQDFRGFTPEIVVSKPEINSPYNDHECDWIIEIYDDYRE